MHSSLWTFDIWSVKNSKFSEWNLARSLARSLIKLSYYNWKLNILDLELRASHLLSRLFDSVFMTFFQFELWETAF